MLSHFHQRTPLGPLKSGPLLGLFRASVSPGFVLLPLSYNPSLPTYHTPSPFPTSLPYLALPTPGSETGFWAFGAFPGAPMPHLAAISSLFFAFALKPPPVSCLPLTAIYCVAVGSLSSPLVKPTPLHALSFFISQQQQQKRT